MIGQEEQSHQAVRKTSQCSSKIWQFFHNTHTHTYYTQKQMFSHLVLSYLVLWCWIRSQETVEEVADGRSSAHHIHTLHVLVKQMLGRTAHQFTDTNGLQYKKNWNFCELKSLLSIGDHFKCSAISTYDQGLIL